MRAWQSVSPDSARPARGLGFARATAILALVLLGVPAVAGAYVDLAPTLGRIVREAQSIVLVESSAFNAQRGIAILQKVRMLKGAVVEDTFRHRLVTERQPAPGDLLEWAQNGGRGVVFVSPRLTLVCFGRGWYQVSAPVDGLWTIAPPRPELPLAYYGSVRRLIEAVELMLAGKQAIISVVPHGEDNEAASFDLALNRAGIAGFSRVQRIRADLNMPAVAMGLAARADRFVGRGPVGADDLPALLNALASNDRAIRQEAAEELRWLGNAAAPAVEPLWRLLDDADARVRMTAAATLLCIAPDDGRALEALRAGLGHADATVRRAAAGAAALTGTSGISLVEPLASLLGDGDELTRLKAVRSLGSMGPAAAGAVPALIAALDKPTLALDAADALGRIGPAAQPALPRLARMLEADAPTLRWAAVRAMAQIGSEQARPAVDFIIRQLPRATDQEAYNMMIYLGLLGPVARDALPAVRSSRVRHPALKPATIWAIDPAAGLPWLDPAYFGRYTDLGVVRYIFQAYVSELGPRLQPAAMLLARKIIEGTAGNVPPWGYALLGQCAGDVVPILSAALADADRACRERITLALGAMGEAAAPARSTVAALLSADGADIDRRLIEWTLARFNGSGPDWPAHLRPPGAAAPARAARPAAEGVDDQIAEGVTRRLGGTIYARRGQSYAVIYNGGREVAIEYVNSARAQWLGADAHDLDLLAIRVASTPNLAAHVGLSDEQRQRILALPAAPPLSEDQRRRLINLAARWERAPARQKNAAAEELLAAVDEIGRTAADSARQIIRQRVEQVRSILSAEQIAAARKWVP